MRLGTPELVILDTACFFTNGEFNNCVKNDKKLNQERGLFSEYIFICDEEKNSHWYESHMKYFIEAVLGDVYKRISKCESEILDINTLLDGPICHSGFKRLN